MGRNKKKRKFEKGHKHKNKFEKDSKVEKREKERMK